jgi:hypothetical protein
MRADVAWPPEPVAHPARADRDLVAQGRSCALVGRRPRRADRRAGRTAARTTACRRASFTRRRATTCRSPERPRSSPTASCACPPNAETRRRVEQPHAIRTTAVRTRGRSCGRYRLSRPRRELGRVRRRATSENYMTGAELRDRTRPKAHRRPNETETSRTEATPSASLRPAPPPATTAERRQAAGRSSMNANSATIAIGERQEGADREAARGRPEEGLRATLSRSASSMR